MSENSTQIANEISNTDTELKNTVIELPKSVTDVSGELVGKMDKILNPEKRKFSLDKVLKGAPLFDIGRPESPIFPPYTPVGPVVPTNPTPVGPVTGGASLGEQNTFI